MGYQLPLITTCDIRDLLIRITRYGIWIFVAGIDDTRPALGLNVLKPMRHVRALWDGAGRIDRIGLPSA